MFTSESRACTPITRLMAKNNPHLQLYTQRLSKDNKAVVIVVIEANALETSRLQSDLE